MQNQVINNFFQLSKYPRPSEHEEIASKWLVEQLKKLDCDVKVDKHNSIYAFRKGKSKPICLTAHIDMVTVKKPSKKHDFFKDPIECKIKNGWIVANGTTLGADNGLGVATILSLLSEPELKNKSIEIVLTTGEETSLIGAKKFDTSLIKSKKWINLDWEEDNSIVVGHASAIRSTIELKIKIQPINTNTTNLDISLYGLRGGHSAYYYQQGHQNAFILLCRLLNDIYNVCHFNIVNIQCENPDNVIPNNAQMTVNIPNESLEFFKQTLNSLFLSTKKTFYPYGEKIFLSCLPSKTKVKFLVGNNGTKKILNFFNTIQNGIIGYNESLMLPTISNNLHLVKIDNNKLLSSYLARTTYNLEADQFINYLKNVANIFNAKCSSDFLGFALDAKITQLAKCYQHMAQKNHHPMKIIAIHASTELASLVRDKTDIEAISVGPLIEYCHSIHERANVKSLQRFYRILFMFLKQNESK